MKEWVGTLQMIGSERCAFFDLDHTILDCDSFRLFLRYIYLRSWKGRLSIPGLVFWGLTRKVRLIPLRTFKEKSLSPVLKGSSVVEIKTVGRQFFENYLIMHIRGVARQRIQYHKTQGHKVIIITGSPDIYVESVRDFLNFDYCICTRLLYEQGAFLGRIDGDDCHGVHKAVQIRKMLADLGIAPKHCYAYSDDISDLPMMKMVGIAIAINPSPPLRRLAQNIGWRVEVW